MNYMEALEALDQLIRTAKSMPLSSSAVVPRDEALALVQALRDSLPRETEQAKQVLAGRDDVIAQARTDAEKLMAEAKQLRARAVDSTDVMQAAKVEAERIVSDANASSEKLKVQADDYVDAKLANFEILLNKVLRTVGRGREQLSARLEAANDLVEPLNLEDSGEISGPISAPPPRS